MIGTTLGSYVIRRELGRGGMGVVYVAEHQKLGNQVAVKVLGAEMSGDPEAVSRFFQEARAAARIRHPSIVQALDFGEHEGRAYYVMELLDGESLRERLRARGKLPVADAALIGEKVAAALAAAHRAGIVHRDLKPDNIFLAHDSDGERVKVLDFGIAKLTGDSLAVSLHTRTGTIMGTAYYMAPEQCRGGGDLDGRADVYALGCVLFECLSGRPPFTGTALGEVLGAHLHVPAPSLRELETALPADVDALVARMLAKRPEDRPASMSDVAAALRRLRQPEQRDDPGLASTAAMAPSSPVAAPTPVPMTRRGGPERVHRAWLVAPTLVLVLGAAIVLAVARRDPRAHRQVTPSAVTPSDEFEAPDATVAAIDAGVAETSDSPGRLAVPAPTESLTENEAALAQARGDLAALAADAPARADALLRLAVLLDDRAQLLSFDPDAADEQRRTANEALATFAALVDAPEHQAYARMDEALYRYGWALLNAGASERAHVVFRRILMSYPDSHYVADANLAFAERDFLDGMMVEAEKRYQQLLDDPRGRNSLVRYARYKHGWTLFNLGLAKLATAEMVRVVEEDGPRGQLGRAALFEVPRTFADDGKPEDGEALFLRLSPDDTADLLAALAEAYASLGKGPEARRTYQLLLARYPADERACGWQVDAAAAAVTTGARTEALEELRRVAGRLAPDGLDAEASAACVEAANKLLLSVAKEWHAQAGKTQQRADFAGAEEIYRLYLVHAPAGPDEAAARYYHGETLWNLERWQDAALEYTRATRTSELPPELHKDAARAAVLAWQKQLPDEDLPPVPEPGAPHEPMRIPESQESMLAAVDIYLSRVPSWDDETAVEVRFLRARIYHSYRHYDLAVPQLAEIVDHRPEHRLAGMSASLLLLSLERAGDKDRLEFWVTKLLHDEKFLSAHPEFRETLEKLRR